MGKNVTPQNPCIICGKPDWCLRIDGQNGPLHYCKRVRDEKVVSGGEIYKLIRTTSECGVYESESQILRAREAYIAELKKNNPNYKPNKAYSPKNPTPQPVDNSYVNRSNYTQEYVEPTEDADKLDKVYRTFLSCLILEKNHKNVLVAEWGEDMFNRISQRYPIKSLPMTDKERYSYGAFFESPWRKKVMEQMCDRGITDEDLTGVPMFYQVDSGTEKFWTFCKSAGIMFPVLNPEGKIIRLRVRDDFPSAKGVFEGEEGNFFFGKDGWYFKGESEPILVYQPKSKTYKVKLDKNGIPLSDGEVKSKVSGKYKNLSSFKEEYDDSKKVVKNKYLNGSQSGSFPSLYCKDTDDFTVVFFTEGEKKSMVCNELLSAPCVSFPGVGTFKKAFEKMTANESIIDYCMSKGMKKAVLCYDADKNSNAQVLMHEQNAIKWFQENHIQIAVGSWNEQFGKGLDDILLKGVRPTIHDVR